MSNPILNSNDGFQISNLYRQRFVSQIQGNQSKGLFGVKVAWFYKQIDWWTTSPATDSSGQFH